MVYTASKELREFVENGMKHNPFAVLSRLVYNGIYREIIGGRLRVSDNIVVSRLAEDLNLSRTPVKIAMEDLLEQSILEKRDGNKLSVKRVTYAECSLLFEARMAIETKSAYLAARRMTDAELKEMKRLLERFQEIDKAQDVERYVHCDRAFHNLVVAASKNKFLVDTYAYLEGPLQRYRFQVTQLPYGDICHRNGIIEELDYHLCVYEALSRHLPKEAEDAIYRDVERMHGTMYMIKN